MSKLRIFIRDFSIVSLGNVFSKFFAALIAIVVARSLGPENFGKYSILFAIMTIIAAGLSGIDYTYVHNHLWRFKSKKFLYSDYVFFKFTITLLLVIVGVFFSPYLSRYVFHNEIITKGLIISFISALSFIAFTQVYTFYQAEQNFKNFSFTQVLFYFIVFLGILFLLFLKYNVYYIFLIPYLVAGLVIFIPFFMINRKEIHTKGIPFYDFFKIGKWIIFSEIFVVLLARLDFLMLSYYFKGEVLGFYSAAMRIINIYLTFTAAFSAIMLPKASRIRNEVQKRQFYKASFILFSLLIILNVILIFSSSIIIRVLFGSQYLPSVKFVRLLLIAYIPFTLYQPFRYLTYTFNKTIILFLVPFLQSFLLILVGPYFILGLGTHGIILAKAIMFIIGFIIFFVSVFREKVSNDR